MVKREGKALTQAALAKALGVSAATITKGKAQGMPTATITAASTWRRENLDPAHRRPLPGEAAPARNPLHRPASTTTAGDGAAKSEATTFQNARTALAVYSAKLSQLEYELQSGGLIRASEVRGEFARVIVALRDRLLRLPDRIVVVIHGETDPRRLRALIDSEVRAALAEFHG